MNDEPKHGEMRPRPQYGEYATPQEQARIIADSLPPVSPLLVPPPVTGSSAKASDAAPRVPGNGPLSASARRPRRWDQILTLLLLGYASINVVAQLVARDTLATILTQFFVAQGIGEYTPTALTTTLGSTLNIVTLVVFVLTVLATAWMLRRGRISFWVPIAGGAVATIVALVFVVILLQSDPAFAAYMSGARP